jgi:replication factor A3
MADSVSTPRINSQYLDAFTGKTVIIVGKVTQLRGESAIIDSEGAVTALLNRVRSLPLSLVLWSLRSINP